MYPSPKSHLAPSSAGKFNAGFSLVELLVVIAVIALLASILIPVIGSAKRKVQAATCTSNLRQLGAAIHLFAVDNNGRLPPKNLPNYMNSVYSWTGKRGESGTYNHSHAAVRHLNRYMGITSPDDPCEVARCPLDTSGGYDIYGSSYSANTTYPAVTESAQDASTGDPNNNGARLNDIVSPSRFVVMGEKGAIDYGVWGALDRNTLHEPGTIGWNLLFADGHVRFVEVKGALIANDQYTFDRMQ